MGVGGAAEENASLSLHRHPDHHYPCPDAGSYLETQSGQHESCKQNKLALSGYLLHTATSF